VPPEEQVELAVAREDAIAAGGGTVVHLPFGHVALENVNGEIRAFSAVCTHLGCIIKWQPAADHAWFCPCHKGKYDREGKVVAGPPPRPLARLPVSVRDGTVFVKMKIRREAPIA
jgi:cytochrome b6-f complex iron-sulfur subunit